MLVARRRYLERWYLERQYIWQEEKGKKSLGMQVLLNGAFLSGQGVELSPAVCQEESARSAIQPLSSFLP